MNGFPRSIVDKYRTRSEQLAPRVGNTPAEYDVTIPLRAGRGFVYVFGRDWAAAWINAHRPSFTLDRLQREFPTLIPQQLGDHECTFRLPMADLGRLLPELGAKTRRRLPEEQRAACVERLRRHRHRAPARQEAETVLESTIGGPNVPEPSGSEIAT